MNKSTTIMNSPTNMSDSWWLENIQLEPDVPDYIVIIITLIGIIGNSFVCLAILLNKKLQISINFLLLSLSIDGLLISAVILPLRVLSHIYVLQPSSFSLCYFYLVSDNYLTTASALHVCVINGERYFAVKNPLSGFNLTNGSVFKKMSIIWFISFLLIVPFIIIIAINHPPTDPAHCPNLLVSMALHNVVLYIESLTIFCVIAIVIFFSIGRSFLVWKQAKSQATKETQNSLRMIKTIKRNKPGYNLSKENIIMLEVHPENKALGIVWSISIAFIITLGPYAVVNMIYLSDPGHEINSTIVKVAVYLTYINSIINPILYTIFDKKFRNAFKNILRFKCQG